LRSVRRSSRVTAQSEVVITVVTDDNAMRRIYADRKDNVLKKRRRQSIHQLRNHHAQSPRGSGKAGEEGKGRVAGSCMASSITRRGRARST